MKKHKKLSSKKNNQSVHHTGIALLVCFIIAALAVILALRQISLEKNLLNSISNQQPNPVAIGTYQVTATTSAAIQKEVTLNLASDRSATLIFHQPTQPKKTLIGNWSSDSNNTVITTFNDRVYAFSYSHVSTPSLKLLNPDLDNWDAATLTLVLNPN